MIGRIIGVLSIPLMAFAIWGLIRQVRKPQRMRTSTPIIGMVMATVMLLVNVLILRQATPGLLGISLLVVGLGFGVAWGQATRLLRRGEAIVAKRSVLHIVFWGFSLAVTQILATFATAVWVAGGLVTMFFAAGTTLGTNANLLVRHMGLRRAPRPVGG
ncbi:MAG: hypothetical protein OEM81_12820 [Acidimicrobiia bacterium]|nr:hypothetical protein [Acidimicrobiia bacterium]MDH3398695.1 hypothetical protein [Acidimicrobiia bacterium]MDH5615384.1 hypothetical protein [Acidimicrobiia bacterium]